MSKTLADVITFDAHPSKIKVDVFKLNVCPSLTECPFPRVTITLTLPPTVEYAQVGLVPNVLRVFVAKKLAQDSPVFGLSLYPTETGSKRTLI